SLWARAIRTPIWRILGCRACAAIGHAAVMPDITLMKSRRRIASPKTREPTRNTSEPSERLQHGFLENGTGLAFDGERQALTRDGWHDAAIASEPVHTQPRA